ncbi:hypothetical protein O8E95_000808 [Enterobacter quasiroggenkampii]
MPIQQKKTQQRDTNFMLTIDEMRRSLRKQYAVTAGQDGEEYAEAWLKKAGWEFEPIEQSTTSMPQKLKAYGGKRPDFIVKADDSTCILLDAKYHSTDNCSTFTLTDSELGKYTALHTFISSTFPDCKFEVVFMLFPKEEDGKKFTFISLEEFENGKNAILNSKNATQISITNRDGLWFNC